MITATDDMTDFLAAVDRLRTADTAARTTAHTSSIIADGWPAAQQ